jgi:hypothetical protein
MPNPSDRVRAVTLTLVLLPISASVTGITKTGEVFVIMNRRDAVQLAQPIKRALTLKTVKQGGKKA